jgi:DNA repair exonuclease SbcCD ATPase subunit
MTNKQDYNNKCFSPNWLEVDLEEVKQSQISKEVQHSDNESTVLNKEVRLESKRRKDLNTLLKELEEIKQNIEKVAEKQHRLANLMSFYSESFAQ